AGGGRGEANAALEAAPDPAVASRALWARAQAEHALGLGPAAERSSVAAADAVPSPVGPRALAAAAGWRWNADDNAGALRLFRQLGERFPDSPPAAEALYATGRIHQEAGRYADAFAAYTAMADRYPEAPLAAEAGWRAGWVRYLARDWRGAADWFRALAARTTKGARVAAEYWRARALEHAGSPDATARLAHVADRHPRTFYGALAAARL